MRSCVLGCRGPLLAVTLQIRQPPGKALLNRRLVRFAACKRGMRRLLRLCRGFMLDFQMLLQTLDPLGQPLDLTHQVI